MECKSSITIHNVGDDDVIKIEPYWNVNLLEISNYIQLVCELK